MSLAVLKKISSSEARNIRLILAGFILFGLISVIFYPLDLLKMIFPGIFTNESSCIMLNLLGIPCPFCGMSHAFYEFIGLNFERSIFYNPSSVIFFSFLGILCLSIFALSLFEYKLNFHFSRKTLLIAILVLLVMWILNILYGHR